MGTKALECCDAGSTPSLPAREGAVQFSGQGGIRTRDTLLTYTRSPGVRLQPLGHLSRLVVRPQLSGPERARQRAP